MKKLFTVTLPALILAAAAIVFTACGDVDNGDNVEISRIGRKGPGFGTIFFAQDGQFLEVSAPLGINSWDEAALQIAAFRGGGFDNWRLPSQHELHLMYLNLRLPNIVSFYNALYWSSTALDDRIWAQNFAIIDSIATNRTWGGQTLRAGMGTFGPPESLLRYRAVRAFRDEAVHAGTSLVIRNESFSEITSVVWGGTTFTQGVIPIRPGFSAEQNVSPGTGFIFFTRGTDPINAKTVHAVTVEEGKRHEFTFLNNTVIVDQANPVVSGTLLRLGRP